jgi:hypothetical protein
MKPIQRAYAMTCRSHLLIINRTTTENKNIHPIRIKNKVVSHSVGRFGVKHICLRLYIVTHCHSSPNLFPFDSTIQSGDASEIIYRMENLENSLMKVKVKREINDLQQKLHQLRIGQLISMIIYP